MIKSIHIDIENLPVHYILELDYEWTDSIGNKYIEIYIVELFGKKMLKNTSWIATFNLNIVLTEVKKFKRIYLMAAKSKIKCFECIKGNGYMIFVEWNFSDKRQKEKHP